MQWSKGSQTLNDRFDFGIHNDSLCKIDTSVDDAMSHDIDLGRPFKDCRFILLKTFQQVLDLFL